MAEDPFDGVNAAYEFLDAFDPFGFTDSLFGKDKKPWSSDYVFSNGTIGPKNKTYVPVPYATVPGASTAPTAAYRAAANDVETLQRLFPIYSRIIASEVIPQEQAKLAAAKYTSPEYAKLVSDLYATYGPTLNKIGTDIARQNALAQAETDKQVLAGPGKELTREALDTAKIYDPEYFATREHTANRLAELLDSINLGSGLSDTERSEVGKGLALEGSRRGTYNAPSQMETVSNAVRYGAAGRNREIQNQDQLTKAIAASTMFLPASKSGVDVFQVATGKPSMYNTGENKFTGVKSPGDDATVLGQNLMNTIYGLDINAQNNALTRDLNEKDWLDKFVQFTGGIGNIVGAAGGIAGMAACWVAREVYGTDSSQWLNFRLWLLNEAPKWFKSLYLAHGERFAQFIKNKPMLKSIVRNWMNRRIQYVK